MEHYDVLIIGGGQCAFPLTDALIEAGKTVAIAERKHLGGSCVNFGCTPTKAAVASAMLAYDARRASEFGLHMAGVEIHYASVLTRARGIKEESREGLEEAYAGKANPKILRGHGRIAGRHERGYEIEVGSDRVSAQFVVLNTGTRTSFPPVQGLGETNCIHAGNWLATPDLPKRLAMLGGGVIALEMSQFYRRMGSEVTVFEMSSRVLNKEDEEVSDAIVKALEGEKVRFVTGARVESVSPDGQGVRLSWNGESEQFDNVFVAAGRIPNTDDLGLELVGVELKEHGVVKVDEALRTTAKDIFAVGDIRGGPQFTHTSYDDYRVMKSQLLGDGSRTTAGRVVPYAVFTDPALGRVGMTETEARASGRPLKIGHYDLIHSGAASEHRTRRGFVKVVIDALTNKVLGGAVVAREGGEMIALLSAMMTLDADYRTIRDSVVSHPTFMEAVQSALAVAG